MTSRRARPRGRWDLGIREILRHRELPTALLLAAALFAAPVPFGGVVPWARTILVAVAVAAVLLAVAVHPRQLSRRVVTIAGALSALALFGFLQTSPLPRFLVRLLSPSHHRLESDAAAALAAAGADAPSWARLTLTPRLTWGIAAWIAALGLAFLAGHLCSKHRSERRLLALATLGSALLLSLYGLRQLTSAPDEILGIEVPGIESRLRGTFVNANHFASFLVMAMALALGWAWWAWRKQRERTGLDAKIVALAPPLLVWLGLFAALTRTASRAGLAAGAISTLVAVAVVAIVERRRSDLVLGAVIGTIGIGTVAGFGVQRAFGRLLATSPLDIAWSARLQVYKETLGLWLRYPVFGSGLGSYRDAFEVVQPRDLPGRWDHAHNDFLELLATGGVLGTALVLGGAAALIARLVEVAVHGIRTEDRAAGLAGLAIVAGLIVHESLDFGLTMPANAFTAAVLLGSLTAASVRRGSRR